MDKLFFLCSKNYLQQASTLLRSNQLCELVRPHLQDRGFEVACTTETAQVNAVLVLSKGFLVDASADMIAGLKKRGNLLIADFVDWKPSPTIIQLVDVLMASSYRQLNYFRYDFPNKPAHLVTHHVDQRIGSVSPPTDRLRVGYFGERFNARFADELSELGGIITFVQTETRNESADWIAHLSGSNCHYALRTNQPHDGFKPFLKGYLAAHCNSPVIADRTEGDAGFYLPEDYPLQLSAASPKEAADGIDRFKGAFGGQEWSYAKQVMREIREQCSPSNVVNEFVKMTRLHVPKTPGTRRSWQSFFRPMIGKPAIGRLQDEMADGLLGVIVPTINSESYIDIILGHYAALGVRPIVFVDGKTTDRTLDIVRGLGFTAHEVANPTWRIGHAIERISHRAGTRWVLRIDDDELPNRKMIDAAIRYAKADAEGVVGFDRFSCAVGANGKLYYHDGHDARTHNQRRLYCPHRLSFVTRGHSPGFEIDQNDTIVEAPEDEFMIHLDWVVHDIELRTKKIERYDAHTAEHGSVWRDYYLADALPDFSSHLLPLPGRDFSEAARRLASRFPNAAVQVARSGRGSALPRRG